MLGAQMTICEIARAKINLSLTVVGRRADGYHELESLTAFAAAGDRLSLTPDTALDLAVDGPTASSAGVAWTGAGATAAPIATRTAAARSVRTPRDAGAHR